MSLNELTDWLLQPTKQKMHLDHTTRSQGYLKRALTQDGYAKLSRSKWSNSIAEVTKARIPDSDRTTIGNSTLLQSPVAPLGINESFCSESAHR